MADSIGNVFLSGEVQVGFNEGGTLARLTSLLSNVRNQIDAFNTFGQKGLTVNIGSETINQISSLTDKFNQMKSAFNSFTFRDSDWAKIAGDMAELHHWMGSISDRTKELTQSWNAMKPNLYIPEIYISSLRAYNYELEKIKASGSLIKAIGKYTPAAQVGVATSPTVPVTTPASVVTPSPSSGGGSLHSQAVEDYRDTVERLYNSLEKVFQASKNTSMEKLWEANKTAIMEAKQALMDFHQLTDNKMGEAGDYVKLINSIGKEGYRPESALQRTKEDLQVIADWKKQGIISDKEATELLKEQLSEVTKIQNVKENAQKLQISMIKEALKAAEIDSKDLEKQQQKTAEFEKQKFLNNAKNIARTGNLGQVEAEKIAVKQRIEQLSKSTVLEDKEELAILQKIIIALHEKENKLKASATATNTQNAHLALAEKFLKGNTAQERASAGLQLQNLTVREKELLLLAAKVKYGTGEIDQLQRRLGLQKGVGSMLSDELKNWPAMLARQAIYGAQWTIIFGTIHRIQATLAAGVQIYKEFEKGTSRALRTGLTPTQLAGAFTSESQKGGSKETVNHYRELLQIQAMLFTSQHKAKVEDYMEAVYELTSANISLHNALKFTDTTMKVAIAAEGNITETTKILAGMYNIYKDSIKGVSSEQEKFNQIANTILVTWSREQVELSELNNAMKYVAASGRALNIDYRVLVTTIGHLNTHMIRSATSGTGLRQMMAQTSKDAGGLKDAFGEFSNDLIKFSKSQEAAFDPNKPTDFIAIMELMRKKLLANRKDFVDYGQDIIFTNKELSEAYKIMSLRGANVGLTLLRTLPELKRKIEETLSLSKNFTDEFIKIQEMNLPQQWEIFIRNLQTVPAAFLLGATHSQSIAEALSNVNEVMGKIIVGAFVVGKTISGWGDAILSVTSVLDRYMETMYKLHTSGVGKALSAIGGLGLGLEIPGIPELYMRGKETVKKTKSEINSPEQFIKNTKTRVEEFLKGTGYMKSTADEAGKSFDLNSKKFLANVDTEIEAINTETETWINAGKHIDGAAFYLKNYTGLYKALMSAFDEGEMGKVSKEFERQTKFITALNKVTEGQIETYNKMRSTSKAQSKLGGFEGVINKNLEERESKLSGIKEKQDQIKKWRQEFDYYGGFIQNLESGSGSFGIQYKLLPEFGQKLSEARKIQERRDELNKELSAYAKDYGINPNLTNLKSEFGSRKDTLRYADYTRINSIYSELDNTTDQKSIIDKIYDDNKNYIISKRKQIKTELNKKENQIPSDYFALIKDKELQSQIKKEEENYNRYHEKFLKETDPKIKKLYGDWMKKSADNINKLVQSSPQFKSLAAQVLESEKQADQVLNDLKNQMESNVNKISDLHKKFRDKLYKELGMPGMTGDEKEKLKLKDDQDARLNMVNAVLREKAQKKQDIRNSLEFTSTFGAEFGSSPDSPESNLKKEYYRKQLEEANDDYAKTLTIRSQLIAEFGKEDANLQLKQQKEFNSIFLTEDEKKRQAIIDNYQTLLDKYQGDSQAMVQIEAQKNKELKKLDQEAADNAIKERQRVMDEIKKLKEEELKHAQSIAEQLLQIDKNKQIGLIKQAGLAEIEKLKASGKADPEAVKKIQEKVNAAIESMTGKYDVKEEELKQQQAGQSINQKQQEYNDLAKRFKDQKAQFEKADKDVSKLKTPAGKNREEWLMTTPEYKRREELRTGANETRSEMLKLSEEIGDLKLTIQESAGKITDIKYNRDIDILNETDYEKQQMKKGMEIKYGINAPDTIQSSIINGKQNITPSESQLFGGGRSNNKAIMNTLNPYYNPYYPVNNNPQNITPSTGQPFGGGRSNNKAIMEILNKGSYNPQPSSGPSSSTGIETKIGGTGGATWVMAINEFNKKENPYNSEKISLDQLKLMRNSRITQLTTEFNLLSKISNVQKFGAGMELGSYKNVGKSAGAIGQTFANILANQASIPKLNIANVFSQDKSLGQINAAIKAKEKGTASIGTDAPGKQDPGVQINIAINDSNGPSKLPGHLEDGYSKIGKETVKYFEDMGAIG